MDQPPRNFIAELLREREDTIFGRNRAKPVPAPDETIATQESPPDKCNTLEYRPGVDEIPFP